MTWWLAGMTCWFCSATCGFQFISCGQRQVIASLNVSLYNLCDPGVGRQASGKALVKIRVLWEQWSQNCRFRYPLIFSCHRSRFQMVSRLLVDWRKMIFDCPCNVHKMRWKCSLIYAQCQFRIKSEHLCSSGIICGPTQISEFPNTSLLIICFFGASNCDLGRLEAPILAPWGGMSATCHAMDAHNTTFVDPITIFYHFVADSESQVR